MAQRELSGGGRDHEMAVGRRVREARIRGRGDHNGLALTPARAEIVVQIDKSSQRMAVSIDGATRYNWPVSTGRNGYGTPSGTHHAHCLPWSSATDRAIRGSRFRTSARS
jgi:lipoprotein-anchoring transpeptidase ErfK/SrfK